MVFGSQCRPGRGVEAVGPQLDARHVGLLHQLRKRNRVPARRLTNHWPRSAPVAGSPPWQRGRRIRARRLRMVLAASCAALPFKSAPVEAAVAEVLATLLVSVALARTMRQIDAQFMRDHLAYLGVDALAHFGAAVVDQYRAVRVHVHQRAGLVEVGDVEGDAEFDRRQRQAALEYLCSSCIEGVDVSRGACGSRFRLPAARPGRG